MAQWTPERKETNRRRLHARRVYKKNPLFALDIIRIRYPDYTESMLLDDLRRRTKKRSFRSKKKEPRDFRRVQLEKMIMELKFTDKSTAAYNTLCHKIALFHQAHEAKQDIRLTCKVENKTAIYLFKWSTTESVIKQFHTAANVKGTTHEQLTKLHEDLTKFRLI